MTLSPGDIAFLAILTGGELAYRKSAEVTWECGIGLDLTEAYLAKLREAGLLERWNPPTNPKLELWTLSPLGAATLGVHLVEAGPDELWKWERDGEELPPSKQAADPALDGKPPRLDIVSLLGLEAPIPTRPKRPTAKRGK